MVINKTLENSSAIGYFGGFSRGVKNKLRKIKK